MAKWGILLGASAIATAYVHATGDPVPPLVLPPLKPLPEFSWRGINPTTHRVDDFDVSGHAMRVPSALDYLRLVPPSPLAFGGAFSAGKMPGKEWICEIAFKQHGQKRTGALKPGESTRKTNKGGRGLGIWYTKTDNPTPVTIPATGPVNAPPPYLPENFPDPTDELISFFGQRTKFDGLGIIFDSAASQPLLPRSDSRGWGGGLDFGQTPGADRVGVVSAIINDGTKSLLDTYIHNENRTDEKEASYLQHSVGECEAAFRNAPGVVWVRISNFNREIRVDLDLAPHTDLRAENRRFSHHCLTVKDVELPADYHFGITGLGSGNAEPDTIDIYAFEAWQVVPANQATPNDPNATEPPPIPLTEQEKAHEKVPLEGTAEDTDAESVSLTMDIMLSQARMMDSIEALARRIDRLSANIGAANVGGDTSISRKLSAIERKLTTNVGTTRAKPVAINEGSTPGPDADQREEQSISYAIQSIHRVMGDLKTVSAKVDAFGQRQMSTLTAIEQRQTELFTKVNRFLQESKDDRIQKVEEILKKTKAKSTAWKGWLMAIVAFTIIIAFALFVTRASGEGWSQGRGKKLI